jgi:TonB family protein
MPGVAIETGRPGAETNLASIKADAGEIEAYKRSIITALARHKPKVSGPVSRGTVRIAFSIGRAGEPESVRVRQSSGRPELDEAALAAVRSTRFEAPPANMAATDLAYEIPYIFR